MAAADPKVDFQAYDLINVLVTPNAGPLRPGHRPVGDLRRQRARRRSPTACPSPTRPSSTAARTTAPARTTRPATAYSPTRTAMSSACPTSTPPTGGGAVGHWDIMSEDWGANNDLLGWHKWKLGWLDARPGRLRGRARHHRAHADPAGRSRAAPSWSSCRSTAKRGYAVEVRTRAGNDEAVCRPGVLIYKVDADVDTGHGPDHGGRLRPGQRRLHPRPNVHAELSDAPFGPRGGSSRTYGRGSGSRVGKRRRGRESAGCTSRGGEGAGGSGSGSGGFVRGSWVTGRWLPCPPGGPPATESRETR